ncbi:MAG: hypothetical protein CMK44_00935 [Porticoccus sp.]|nr:hypothetical protein [Porticoccus sp.]
MGEITLLSREQEKKKVFSQLGKRFGLPKELIIYLYQILMNSIKHDRSLQINFHKNILSFHLFSPNHMVIEDTLLKPENPFQYRYPIGKGNEWLIYSDKARKDNIMYEGYYNQLKPRDIICQQIEIYGNKNFILKHTRWCEFSERSRCYDSLIGMERIKFIDNMNINLFDHYWDYLEDERYNIEKRGDSYRGIIFIVPYYNQEQ